MRKNISVNRIWLPLTLATVLSACFWGGAVARDAGNPSDNNPVTIREVQLPPPAAMPPAGGQAQPKPVADNGLQRILDDLAQRFPTYSTDTVLIVDTQTQPQRMDLVEYGQVTQSWIISAAEKGIGSRKGSEQTPPGVHRIAKKIGDGAPLGTIFKARQNTGQVARILKGSDERSNADNVTTRILWLDGLEPGVNKGGNVDSFQRYIYIHGTDEEGRLGRPASHGCIRMANQDVVDLFGRVGEDTLVVILPN